MEQMPRQRSLVSFGKNNLLIYYKDIRNGRISIGLIIVLMRLTLRGVSGGRIDPVRLWLDTAVPANKDSTVTADP